MDEKVQELHKQIRDLRDQLKTHGEVTVDPRCAALCETSSEVMSGLEKAFDDFINKSEKAWQA